MINNRKALSIQCYTHVGVMAKIKSIIITIMNKRVFGLKPCCLSFYKPYLRFIFDFVNYTMYDINVLYDNFITK